MQLKWIEDLIALAETNSFSRAADIRCISQSALSRRIQSLESWVGVELVNRGIYPAQLTSAGQAFYEQSRETLLSLLAVREELLEAGRMPGDSIAVTVGHTLSVTFLPKWLKQQQARNGHFKARVVAANVHQAVMALEEGHCDLMIGYHHPHAPISLSTEKFSSLSLGLDSLVPVSAPGRRGRPLFTLPGSPHAPTPHLAYTESTFLRRIVDTILKRSPTPYYLETCYEGDMAVQVMQMAREGYGLAWLPKSAAQEELARGTLVPAGSDAWNEELEIRSYRTNGNNNATMQAFWSALKHDSEARQG